MNAKKLVKACGSKEIALFFITWLKHDRNGTKAYLELHPRVDRRSAGVLGARMLAKVSVDTVLSAYDLGFEKYMKTLKEGLDANKIHGTSDNFIEIPDHAVREKYLTKLGKILRLEAIDGQTLHQTNIGKVYVELPRRLKKEDDLEALAETTTGS